MCRPVEAQPANALDGTYPLARVLYVYINKNPNADLDLCGTACHRHSQTDQFRQIRFKNKLDLRGPWSFWSDIILIDTADDSNINMNTYRNLDQFWIGAGYDI